MNEFSGIKVIDLFNLDILKNASILSGKNGLHRQITKINVMEVPDILDWVTPNEFLLTTAYSIKDDINKLSELIPELKNKGLAGLGIKTKRYIKEIPQGILDIADDLDFPIIEIPFDVSYSEIITSSLSEIVNIQANILGKIDNLHNRLMSVILKGGSLYEIGQGIHESINNSLAISENIFKTDIIICCKENRNDIENIIRNIDTNLNNTSINVQNELAHFISKDIINGSEIERIDIPICIENEDYGYIHIWQDKKKLTNVELKVIKSSIPIIALDLVKKLSIYEIENKHRIEFFDKLLSSDIQEHKKAKERGMLFGFDETINYTVSVIKIKNIDKLFKLTTNNSNFLQKLNSKIATIIKRISKLRSQKILYANKTDKVIILFGSNKKKENSEVKKEIIDFNKKIYELSKKEHIANEISIGIGRTYQKGNELWKSLDEANRACDNTMEEIKNEPIHYDDLGIYRILSHEGIKDELYEFYKETLEPLERYDKEKASELLYTLKKYFECSGNLKKVSQEMYTHYNTIIYRMQRIKEIIGVDLEDHNAMLNLQICLKIYDVNKNKKHFY